MNRHHFTRVFRMVAATLILTAPRWTAAQIDQLAAARALVNADKAADAEAALRQILQEHDDSAEAHSLLAYVLFTEDKLKASLDEYGKAARYRPASAEDLAVMGCDFFLLKDYAAADKLLSESLAMNRESAVALYFLGRTRYMERRFDDAAELFAESLKLRPDYVHAQLFLALCYQHLGKTSQAEAMYQAAIAHATDAGPWRGLGALLASTGRVAEAIPYLQKAAEISPGEARSHRELGAAYMTLGNSLDAQRELRKAADLDPKDSATRSLLAQVYRSVGLDDRAAAEARRYRELTGHDLPLPSDDRASGLQAVVQRRDGGDANKGSGVSAESDPNRIQALYDLGRTKYNENRFDEAAAAFGRCLKLDPKNVKAEYELGLAYERLGRRADAMIAFRTAISWQTGAQVRDAGPYLDLGRLTIEAHRAGEAAQYLLEAEKIAPQDTRVHRELGKAYLHMRMLPKARAELEKAVELDPSDAEAHSMLATVYRQQGLADKGAKGESALFGASMTGDR